MDNASDLGPPGQPTLPAPSGKRARNFCLDEHVQNDNLLRRIDAHLDLRGVRQELKPFSISTGRSSIDPELLMRILIVG